MSDISNTDDYKSIPDSGLADAVIRLASHLGKNISHELALKTFGAKCNHSEMMLATRILTNNNLSANLIKNVPLDTIRAPSCLFLTSGKVATVLKIDGYAYYFADLNTRNGIVKIPRENIEQIYAGIAICAAVSLDDIERRMVKEPEPGHWFWKKIKEQHALFKDVILGSLIANLLAACISLFTLQIYDRVIPHQSQSTLWVLVVGVILAIILEGCLRVARAHLLDISGRKIELDLSEFLFKRFLGTRCNDTSMSPGRRIHAIKEFSSVREFFTTASIGSAADIPFSIIFLALIYAIAGNVAFVVLAAMGFIILPSLFAQKKMAKLSEEMLDGSSVANRILIETAYAPDTIKSQQAAPYFQKKWYDIARLNIVKVTSQRILSAGLTYSAAAIQQLAYTAAIVFGVFMVFEGSFTVGSIIAISILSTRTLSPITQLATIITRWQQVRASLIGLDEIANSAQDRPYNREFLYPESVKGNLSISDLKFQYEDTPPIINIKNINLHAKENVAILGVNGCGKSTLLKILSGMYDYSDGSVSIDGLDIRQIDPTFLSGMIGYLPQEVRLFSGTLRDNLIFGSQQWDEVAILRALKFAGLKTFISNDPRGLDLIIHDGGVGLSLGQRQCVGLARLYLRNPRIVLLDEPTASLDQNLEATIIVRMQSWLAHRTCIITTHRIPPLKLVDRVIVLQNGQVVMDKPKKEALSQLTVNQSQIKEPKTKSNDEKLSA